VREKGWLMLQWYRQYTNGWLASLLWLVY